MLQLPHSQAGLDPEPFIDVAKALVLVAVRNMSERREVSVDSEDSLW